ncbi:MAG: hypothetical protein ACI9SP_004292 [Arenicella sp.]|jgi:hypothetical protein
MLNAVKGGSMNNQNILNIAFGNKLLGQLADD